MSSHTMRSTFVLLIVLISMILMLWWRKNQSRKDLTNKHAEEESPYEKPIVVRRFRFLMCKWKEIAKDETFRRLAGNLMIINSSIPPQESNKGSVALYEAFRQLDDYVKTNMMRRIQHVRVTLIYTDGILFYDTVVPMSKIYFMDGNLPKPVSLYTLGSPLKDHNTLPEVTNSVVVTDSHDIRLSGMRLGNDVYRQLLRNGFGFYERMSSSLNRPFAYVAKFLPINDKHNNKLFAEHGFVDGFTLRVGMDILREQPTEYGRF